jgi:hypothetical protein
MSKRRIPVLSIVLYTLSGLLILYTIWGFSESLDYINEAVAAGQLVVQGNLYSIVNFYMSNCAQYAVFAVILFTLGWGLQFFTRCKIEKQEIISGLPENNEASGSIISESDSDVQA